MEGHMGLVEEKPMAVHPNQETEAEFYNHSL